MYVAYTLRPPYAMMSKLGRRMTVSTDAERSMSFDNFLARQTLRDEAMASASAAWLAGLSGHQRRGVARLGEAGRPQRRPGPQDVSREQGLLEAVAGEVVQQASLRLCRGQHVTQPTM